MRYTIIPLLALLTVTVGQFCNLGTNTSIIGTVNLATGEYLGQSFKVPSMVGGNGFLNSVKI